MAKLPALVSALAAVDGRERKTVEHVARLIRERGYITTGKRGGGADEKTAREAANLLIALNGGDAPKDGPLAIDRFRSLRQFFRGTGADIRERLDSYEAHPKPVRDVMDVHTFGEAIEAVIEGVPELVSCFRAYAHEAYTQMDAGKIDEQLYTMLRMRIFGFDITFKRYAARMQLFTMQLSERRVEFETNFMQDVDRMESGFYGKAWPDRDISVTIGMPTLIAIWQVLNPGIELPGIPALAIDQASDDEPAADEE